jgi:flavin reductase (DIM6/NTAB) family NADH-FMN oxidoreductase RutF
MDHKFFDFAALSPADRYGLMANAVTPRPIAFVTTMSADGIANAAPFSFFGLLSHDPATLAIGIEARADGTRKDTARNILETGMFTVHIADAALAAQMDGCGAPLPPEIDELAAMGLQTCAGKTVNVPRIVSAPVAMECRLHSTIDLGPARDVILGTIDGFFLREDALTEAGRVDQDILDAVGRVGGGAYCTTRDRFHAPRG